MSYYVCIGKTNYYATLDKPVYTEFVDPTFIDYLEYFVGYAKTPRELGLTYPFPANYIDLDRKIWALRSGVKPDNHQFMRSREINWQNQVIYRPRNREKPQPSNAPWGLAQMGSTWKALKQKGVM